MVSLGTAIYVFCALAESKTSPIGDSIMGIVLVLQTTKGTTESLMIP